MNTRLFFQTCLLLLCILTLSTSCKKEKVEPELVPITTTGENTMGFYVDGVPINIKGEHGGLSSSGVTGGLINGKILYILGSPEQPNKISSITIFLPLDETNKLKDYILNKSIRQHNEVEIILSGPLGGEGFKTDSIHTGKLTLTKCEDNIVSGTFYFDAFHHETGKVIHVTDGRFDININ